jgi:hypothetical protein
LAGPLACPAPAPAVSPPPVAAAPAPAAAPTPAKIVVLRQVVPAEPVVRTVVERVEPVVHEYHHLTRIDDRDTSVSQTVVQTITAAGNVSVDTRVGVASGDGATVTGDVQPALAAPAPIPEPDPLAAAAGAAQADEAGADLDFGAGALAAQPVADLSTSALPDPASATPDFVAATGLESSPAALGALPAGADPVDSVDSVDTVDTVDTVELGGAEPLGPILPVPDPHPEASNLDTDLA